MLRKPQEKSNKELENNLIDAVRSSGVDNTKNLRIAIDEILAKRDYINNLIKVDPSSKGSLIPPSLDTQIKFTKTYGDNYRAAPALNLAVREGNEDALKLLIKAGADVNLCDTFDSTYSYSMLHATLAGGTPLTIAAKNGDINCMTILLNNGANIHQRDSQGNTALAVAARRNDTQCMKLLIDKGANINLKDSKGNTPLMIATKEGSINCVELLLKARANVTTKSGSFGLFGKTALQMAREQDPPVCVEMLLKAQKAEGAERTKRFLYSSTSSVQHERKQESQDYNKLSPGPSYSSFDPKIMPY